MVARSIPCEGAGELMQPDFGSLSEITRAIHHGHVLQISYLSLSSGAAKKIIVPVALADNGLRWHVRAYDRQRKRFADFVLTRIDKVKALDELAASHERIEADEQWNRRIELRMRPHPGLKHPEAIMADYRMQNGLVTLNVSAALAGYALLRWAVDCSPEWSLDSARHHLCLADRSVLEGVDSAVLAPGFVVVDGAEAP
jgi:hypothetical protein